MEIPVFLFTGFLDAGKTTLIKRLLEQGKLGAPGEPALLLLCETGLEDYPEDFLRAHRLRREVLRAQDQLTGRVLEELRTRHGCGRVIIELNGFWPCRALEQALPETWRIREKVFCANAETFELLRSNLKGQTGDKIAYSSLVLFNRVPAGADTAALHRQVRLYGRRARIVFEDADGRQFEDETVEETPYSLDTDPVEVPDSAFALWMHDLERRPERYLGRTFRLRGQFLDSGGVRYFGRSATTGGVRDAEFWGLASGTAPVAPSESGWHLAAARLLASRAPGGEPELHILDASPTYPPAQLLAILS